MKKTMKKAGAIALATLVAGFGLGVGAGFVLDQPDIVEKEIVVEKTVEVPGPIQTVTEVREVPVEVEKEVVVEVPLNGTDDVVEFIIDQDGDLRELDIDEIEDHGLDELVAQVAFIRESKLMAADFIDRELADELDRREVGTIELDEDDIDRVRVDDDIDEISIDDIDFEDLDAEVTVRAEFEHDDIEYEAFFRVEIRDGDVDDVDVIEVNEL